jgi:hypothetical protein
MANSNGGTGDLTPEQKEDATQAAKDAIWHDEQIKRLGEAYDKAKAVGDFRRNGGNLGRD